MAFDYIIHYDNTDVNIIRKILNSMEFYVLDFPKTLDRAIRFDNVKVLKEIVKKYNHKKSPFLFYAACMVGDIESVKKMLENGVDPNIPYIVLVDGKKQYGIKVALSKKHYDIVKLLYPYGNDILSGKKLLLAASISGDVSTVENLLGNEEDISFIKKLLFLVAKYAEGYISRQKILKMLKKHILKNDTLRNIKLHKYHQSDSLMPVEEILKKDGYLKYNRSIDENKFMTSRKYRHYFDLFRFILPNTCIVTNNIIRFELTTYGELETKPLRNIITQLKNDIQNCNKQFIVAYLSLSLPGSGHANALIIDNYNKTIERFEPHGISENKKTYKLGNLIDNFFKTYFNKYKYFSPLDFCPYYGPQSLHGISDKRSEHGFCVGWSWWYVLHRISYPDVDRKELLDILLTKLYSKNFTMYIYSIGSFLNQIEWSTATDCDKIMHVLEWLKNAIDNNDDVTISLLTNRILEEGTDLSKNIFYNCSSEDTIDNRNYFVNYITNMLSRSTKKDKKREYESSIASSSASSSKRSRSLE